jgi:hypothetical protein
MRAWLGEKRPRQRLDEETAPWVPRGYRCTTADEWGRFLPRRRGNNGNARRSLAFDRLFGG